MSSTAAPSGLDRLEKNVSQKVTAAPAQSQSTPVTVTISAACPNALACAPERTQTASFVKNAVKSINDMFDILNHPESASEYSDMQRVSYRTHGTIANYNLTAASTILSAWSASVAHHIDDINREISNTVTVEVALHEQMKGHTSMVQNVSSRISDATQHLKHESEILDKAQRRFVEEQEEYTKAVQAQDRMPSMFAWVKLAAASMHVVTDVARLQKDIARDEETVSVEKQRVEDEQGNLEKLSHTLKGLQEDGLKLNAQLTAVQAKQRELESQKAKLAEDIQYLDPVAACIHDSCIPAVTAALVETKGTSVKTVAETFKFILGALKEESGLMGDFATVLDDHKAAEIQKKIATMLNAGKPIAPKSTK